MKEEIGLVASTVPMIETIACDDASLRSRSVRGTRSMDIFTTRIPTSKKLGVCAYTYLRDRISRRFELLPPATVQDTAVSG